MDKSKLVLGDDHPDTLTSISNLASTYQKQGKWKEAEAKAPYKLGAVGIAVRADDTRLLAALNQAIGVQAEFMEICPAHLVLDAQARRAAHRG